MKVRAKHIAYFLPCKPSSVYVNITNKCLNECLFCIKRSGTSFFGSDLDLSVGAPAAEEVIDSVGSIDREQPLKEIVFCGMGEPLLRYDCVLEVCREVRNLRGECISFRVDSSGLVWSENKRIDFLAWIDDLSVSLNAENSDKYEELCRPRISGAYEILMDFLHALKAFEVEKGKQGAHFPRVRLSIVDTSEEEFVPASGRTGYAPGTFPVPNLRECHKIANEFGWPLIVKRLFRDSCDEVWGDPAIQEMCSRGIEIGRCRGCTYRH